MEAICSSETSVASQQTTRRPIPEDDTLHNHRCKNKSYKDIGVAVFVVADQPSQKSYHLLELPVIYI
jgi:hypothetical protein